MMAGRRGVVLELVRRGRARTRHDLSEIIGLSRSAVAQTVSELIAEGVLIEDSRSHGDGPGRPSTRLRLVSPRGLAGSVHIAHQHVGVALGDLDHGVAGQLFAPMFADASAERTLQAAERLLLELVDRHGARPADLRAVGIGVPFPVVDGVTHPIGDVPAWDGARPADLLGLGGLTEAAIVVENDANMAAWGEFVQAGENLQNLVYLQVGDGVGAGMIIDGRIACGARGLSGEIGHVLVPGCTVPCRCGRFGCLDALVTLADESGEPDAVRRAGAALGTVLAHVSSFLDPDLVVLGGTLGGDPEFFGSAGRVYREASAPSAAALTMAALGRRSVLLGTLDRAVGEAWAEVSASGLVRESV